MKQGRIYNFNAGPAALPLPVLEEIQESFLNYAGTGMSITEISHRSKQFDEVINDAVARTKRLLGLDDRYQVLFVQGGASLQFCMIPMNFLADGRSADYVDTGTWSTKAIKEAQILGKNIQVVASSEDKNYSYIPTGIPFNSRCRVRPHHLQQHHQGNPVGRIPGHGQGAAGGGHVLGHHEPTHRCRPLRPDLRRGPEKHRAGRGLHGDHPRRHAGAGARTTCLPCSSTPPMRTKTPCTTPPPALPSTRSSWC